MQKNLSTGFSFSFAHTDLERIRFFMTLTDEPRELRGWSSHVPVLTYNALSTLTGVYCRCAHCARLKAEAGIHTLPRLASSVVFDSTDRCMRLGNHVG